MLNLQIPLRKQLPQIQTKQICEDFHLIVWKRDSEVDYYDDHIRKEQALPHSQEGIPVMNQIDASSPGKFSSKSSLSAFLSKC